MHASDPKLVPRPGEFAKCQTSFHALEPHGCILCGVANRILVYQVEDARTKTNGGMSDRDPTGN